MKTQILAATTLALFLAAQSAAAQTSGGSSGAGSSATGSTGGMGSNTTAPGTTRTTPSMDAPGADTGSVDAFGADVGAGAGTGTNIDATGESLGSASSGNLSDTMPSNMNSGAFGTFARGRWDANGDGIVSSREWNDITPTWFGGTRGDASMRSMSTWDTNHSGDLDSTELQNVFSNSGLYQLYDLNNDGTIDSGEAERIPTR